MQREDKPLEMARYCPFATRRPTRLSVQRPVDDRPCGQWLQECQDRCSAS